MKKSRVFLILAAIALAGCETCANHPIPCAVAGAVVVATVAAVAQNNAHHHPQRDQIVIAFDERRP